MAKSRRLFCLRETRFCAKFLAEHYLEDAQCYNEVRAMYGYTGKFQGKNHLSVQGTGMGVAASQSMHRNSWISIQVKRLIRIGSCGAMQAQIALGDIILAQERMLGFGF
ncbi:MAG: hypothetical protein R3B47_15520 [Bacteroidia bacterium]